MKKQTRTSINSGQRIPRVKRDVVRERLLETAARLFAEKGFDATTLEDVAESAGFSKGAVYSNFSGKDDLFCALMDKRVDDRIKLMGSAFTGAGSLEQKSMNALRLLEEVVLLEDDWQILFIEYWLRVARNPSLRERFTVRRRGIRAIISKMLDEQAADNGLDYQLPADYLALAVLALSNGLGIERIADPDSVPTTIYSELLPLLFQGARFPHPSELA